ncbi:hypothetical protein CE91St41_04460 [Oscillospiraceae bacterium]|nr:hypothetical protein CE91St40_04480 [Oscillospiraceae bacterium]BDF73557.1 hypothetical protein CE91St41_04460 [Oscillospiraceae bacterium]
MILVVIYAWLGYWAAGLVLYYNKIVFRKMGMLFLEKLFLGIVLGWALIPIAIIMKLFKVR